MQVMQVTSSNDDNLLIAVVVVHIFSETDPLTFNSIHYIHMLFCCGLCLLTIESHNIAQYLEIIPSELVPSVLHMHFYCGRLITSESLTNSQARISVGRISGQNPID